MTNGDIPTTIINSDRIEIKANTDYSISIYPLFEINNKLREERKDEKKDMSEIINFNTDNKKYIVEKDLYGVDIPEEFDSFESFIIKMKFKIKELKK